MTNQQPEKPALRVVVMGVSGCGKSSVGAALAARLDCRFLDADDYHPPANRVKMVAGTPLTDEDRWPWLERLTKLLAQHDQLVMACSALKRAYRDVLRGSDGVRFVYLEGDQTLIAERLSGRLGHFMPSNLLDSQFAVLEEPAGDEQEVVRVRIDQDFNAVLEQTQARI